MCEFVLLPDLILRESFLNQEFQVLSLLITKWTVFETLSVALKAADGNHPP